MLVVLAIMSWGLSGLGGVVCVVVGVEVGAGVVGAGGVVGVVGVDVGAGVEAGVVVTAGSVAGVDEGAGVVAQPTIARPRTRRRITDIG